MGRIGIDRVTERLVTDARSETGELAHEPRREGFAGLEAGESLAPWEPADDLVQDPQSRQCRPDRPTAAQLGGAAIPPELVLPGGGRDLPCRPTGPGVENPPRRLR